MQMLKGTGVALVTPFNARHEVDFDALDRLINHVIGGGVEFLVSLGTTGETATLTSTEKKDVLAHTVRTAAGRVPVVAGFGGNNTQGVADDIRSANLDGVAAILSVSPYYNKPTQEGIFHHYKVISEASPLPVILYNVPGRTSSNITAATTLRIAGECPNVIGIKEASGNLEQCMAIVKDRPEGFLVTSGEDALTLPMISFGMDGVISVVANAFPREYSNMVRFALEGRFEAASRLHFALFDIINLLFAEGNPGGVKCALKHLRICDHHMRLPLWNVSSELDAKMAKAIDGMVRA
jgi:4-hydroxy-tetrahydrodipicolinate synthase